MAVNENSGYERVKAIRDEMATAILEAIEKNPKEWERGWTAIDITTPLNGKSGKAYKGFNSLYLYFMQVKKKYNDPRWVTFNQAKDLGASVKKGEKSSPILFYQLYDKNTKKEYNPLTVRDMSDDEKRDYMQNNVRRILKYSTVFNAEQCDNFPERKTDELLRMSEEERARQNALIEQVIANSAAPVYYDGGDRAYYSLGRDSVHLPKIEAFHTMQDYYATAIHEIAHSTGHKSRLNRFGTANDVGSYAIEELRAELASMFIQRELGISISGAHFENHAAYLNSWLNAVKNDKQLFFNAVRDAEKISDYVAEHYLQAEHTAELDAENTKEKTPVFDAEAVFSEQIDAVLSGADTESTHIKVSNTPKILRDAGLPFSSAPFDGEEDFNPYVFDGSMSVEDYKRMHDDIEAVALLNEPLYGVVYDWKGLKEENTIYTTEQLQEHMPGFDSQADLQEGAFDANKTYTVIKLNGSEETETRYKVQSFLTGKYNYAPEGIDDWYWETRSDNLFTGEANPTADKIIQYFNLKGEELTMNESKNTNKEKNKTLKLGKEIIEVHGMYRNNLMRTYEEAKAEATTLTRETQEPYLIIGKSEAPAGIKTWFNEGNILPLSEAKRIFELLNEEFKREKQKAPIRFAIAYTFEGKEEFQEGLNYVFGAEKRDFQNVIEKHFRGNSNGLTRYFTRHIELNEMLHAAQAEKLPLQEQFNIQSFILAEAKIMNHAKPFTAYKPATYLDHENIPKEQEEQVRKIKAKDLQIGDIVLNRDGTEDELRDVGVGIDATVKGLVRVESENEYGMFAYMLDADETVTLSPRSPIRESAPKAESTESREREDAAAREDFPNDFEDEFTEALLDHFEEEQKSTDVKEPVQNAADGQERRSETLGEELTKQSIWLKIGLSEGAVGNKFGKNLLIRMPKGEYSGFGLFVDAKYIKTSTDGNSVLTVGDKLKYRINNDGRQVELTGAELKDVFAGKTLNKTPERVAPSKRNKAALDRLAKNIPAELKEQPCWGVYFTTPPKDPNKKKRDKVILSPTNGKWARANDPESWTDFETAMKYAREHNHEGLSLLLTKNSGITCIDLDECIDAAGKYNGIAEKLTNELNGTYTERSVSGNGLHIFVKDDVLKDGQYKSTARTEQGELEVYDSAHIISLTGDMVSKTNELTKSPTATTLYMRETLGERQRTNAPVIRDVNSTYRAGSDNEVIERIRKSKRGADFEALFTGKGITGNASVDDMKLANILVFFTDCDAAQSLRIMKSSASYRPDKSENYYTHTIGRAIETLSTRPMYGAGNRAGANKGKRGQGSER